MFTLSASKNLPEENINKLSAKEISDNILNPFTLKAGEL